MVHECLSLRQKEELVRKRLLTRNDIFRKLKNSMRALAVVASVRNDTNAGQKNGKHGRTE
jgi:hypothetical protein